MGAVWTRVESMGMVTAWILESMGMVTAWILESCPMGPPEGKRAECEGTAMVPAWPLLGAGGRSCCALLLPGCWLCLCCCTG